LTVLSDMVPVKDEYSNEEVLDILLAIQSDIEAMIETGKTPPYAYIDVRYLEKCIEFLRNHIDEPNAVDELIKLMESGAIRREVNGG
jgi:hypothetical protein